MSNIYILKLEQKASDYKGKCYRFNGANGKIRWPIEDGAFLGEAGAWNFFWRLGFHPQLITVKNYVNISADDIIVVCATTSFDENTLIFIKNCLAKGAKMIASGNPNAWEPVLGSVQSSRYDQPYAALAYMINKKMCLIAPPAWTYMQQKNEHDEFEAVGQMVAIHGERQSPKRALVTTLMSAPAALKKRNFMYLNANPFAAFQAWLQGQEDLYPWIQWRNRLFWLDEWVADLKKFLNILGIDLTKFKRAGIDRLNKITVVLRHDLDSSRDTAYLDEERIRKFPAVHAVLKDGNRNYWLKTLKKYPEQEIAFHYNTISSSPIKARLESLFGMEPKAYRPAYKEITGKGLLNQIQWANKKGILTNTLHRHGSFLIYPEWIDAFKEVLDNSNCVLGSSSLFRGQVLRWGVDRVDNLRGTTGDFPDAQFPLWYPFKLAHAGDNGEMLRGWESTSIMEIEPEFFKQLISYKIPELPQRIITLNFHPAHANVSTFTSGGSLKWFKDILDIIEEMDIRVETLGDIYKRADESIIEESC